MSKGKKRSGARPGRPQPLRGTKGKRKGARLWYVGKECRSEERFSRNAETDLVCRLLLEKKKKKRSQRTANTLPNHTPQSRAQSERGTHPQDASEPSRTTDRIQIQN